MRQIVLVAGLAFVISIGVRASVARAESTSSSSSDIVVEVEDLENEDGVVRCGLYTESNWLDADRAVQWVDAEYGDGDTATCRFEAIESGTYGVGAFHDQDADHDMDRNLVGIPTEGVCASNDPEPGMGAPDFKNSKFDHDSSRSSVPCTMRY